MKHTPISSSQSSIGGLSSDFVVFLKTLIISSSEIVCTGSELILTSSELIRTSSELISTSSELIRAIAEQNFDNRSVRGSNYGMQTEKQADCFNVNSLT